MGGAVPASLSRALTEIHQEGIRFPPMKLVREGVFDEMILRIMKGRSGSEGVQAAFDAVCERFPELPRPLPVREAAE